MTAARLPAAVRDLLRAAPDAPGPDADLLARFVAARDEAAFAALVRRHGGTVWDVCRSVVGNRADADDAFQAVFLILARRAGRMRKPASVGAWLHGVALRVARKARASAARRQLKEAAAQPPGAVEPSDTSWAEVRAAVHDALAALPAVYREPLVACYLRGLTHDATAAELGLSKAAVKKRLERGRDRLRAALTLRGFGPSAVLAVAAAPVSAVPVHLLDAAPRLVAGAAPIPPAILRLVEGGTSMTFAKLAAVAGLVAAMGMALAAGPDDDRRPPPPNPPPSAPKLAAAKETPPAKVAEAKEALPVDVAAMVGKWAVTWIETGGEALFDRKNHDETLPAPTFAFDGNRCTVTGLRVLFVRDFTFKLAPDKTPMEIDATFVDGPAKGSTFPGIYVLRGDELRVCLRLQNLGLGRPKGFVTNSGTTLYTFILTRGRTAPPPAPATPPPAPRPAFDAILSAGDRVYFVLDTPKGKAFEDVVTEFARRLDVPLAFADRVKGSNVSLILFQRDEPKETVGAFTGLTRDQFRRYAALPVKERATKLHEHAWTLGRLPKDAVPLPPEPPPPARGR